MVTNIWEQGVGVTPLEGSHPRGEEQIVYVRKKYFKIGQRFCYCISLQMIKMLENLVFRLRIYRIPNISLSEEDFTSESRVF